MTAHCHHGVANHTRRSSACFVAHPRSAHREHRPSAWPCQGQALAQKRPRRMHTPRAALRLADAELEVAAVTPSPLRPPPSQPKPPSAETAATTAPWPCTLATVAAFGTAGSDPSPSSAGVPSFGISPDASAAFAPAAAATSLPATVADAWDPPEWLQRTTLLLGREGVSRLHGARVVVVGLGGVGSYVAELLVRAGVGALALVDGDVVDVTNKNRQLPALDSTIGRHKALVVSQRLLDINPHLNLVVRQEFLGPDGAAAQLLDEVAADLDRRANPPATSTAAAATTASTAMGSTGEYGAAFPSRPAATSDGSGHLRNSTTSATSSSSSITSSGRNGSSGSSSCISSGSVRGNTCLPGGSAATAATTLATAEASVAAAAPLAPPPLHWVVDCIDTVSPKLALVAAAVARGAGVVSSMGAGGRMDPLAVHVADISETYGDPFAATCRRGLRRHYGIRDGVTVVFSTEPCRRASLALTAASPYKRSYYGTISFLPAIFGLHIAAHIVNAITDGPMIVSEAAQRQELRAQRDVATGVKQQTGGGGGGNRHARARARARPRGGRTGAGGAGASPGLQAPLSSSSPSSLPLPPSPLPSPPATNGSKADGSGRPCHGARVSLADAVSWGGGYEGVGI